MKYEVKHRDYGTTVVSAKSQMEALKKAAKQHGTSDYAFSFGAAINEVEDDKIQIQPKKKKE